MALGIVLLVLNLGIGFWLLSMLRKQDLYSFEPMSRIALATVMGGFISIAVTFAVGLLLKDIGLDQGTNVWSFFLLTGPIEETSKLFAFFAFIWLFKIKFEEPIDSVVYMSCVALGFSLIENLGYALGAPLLLGVRSVTATPMHIVFSATMALVLSAGASRGKFVVPLIKAVLLASFLHGLYDALVYLRVMTITNLYLVILISVFWAQRIFGYALLNSPSRSAFLDNIEKKGLDAGARNCLVCGKDTPHKQFKYNYIAASECQHCKNIILPAKKARGFLNFYLPFAISFSRKRQDLKDKLDSIFIDFTDKNYDHFRKINIQSAKPVIADLAEEYRKVFEKGYTFSFIFGTRPLFSTTDGILNEHFKNTIHSQGLKAAGIVVAILLGTVGFALGLATVLNKI